MKIYRIATLTGDQEAERQHSVFLENTMKRDISLIFIRNLKGPIFYEILKTDIDAKYDKKENLIRLLASVRIKRPFPDKALLENSLNYTKSNIDKLKLAMKNRRQYNREETEEQKSALDKTEKRRLNELNRIKEEKELAIYTIDHPQDLLFKIKSEIEKTYGVPAQVSIFDINNKRFGE